MVAISTPQHWRIPEGFSATPGQLHGRRFTLGVPLERISDLMKRTPAMKERLDATAQFCTSNATGGRCSGRYERDRLMAEVLQLLGGDRQLYPKADAPGSDAMDETKVVLDEKTFVN
eukprot:Skav214271  [mRNA]  locus=scaffold642:250271:253179:+ [translate_table: standard]